MGLRDILRGRPVAPAQVGDVWEGNRAYIQEKERVPWPGTYALLDDDFTPFAVVESVKDSGSLALNDIWVIKELI